MPSTCCQVNCNARCKVGASVSVPRDVDRRLEWLTLLGRNVEGCKLSEAYMNKNLNSIPATRIMVCKTHFPPGSFDEKSRVKSYAKPYSVFGGDNLPESGTFPPKAVRRSPTQPQRCTKKRIKTQDLVHATKEEHASTPPATPSSPPTTPSEHLSLEEQMTALREELAEVKTVVKDLRAQVAELSVQLVDKNGVGKDVPRHNAPYMPYPPSYPPFMPPPGTFPTPQHGFPWMQPLPGSGQAGVGGDGVWKSIWKELRVVEKKERRRGTRRRINKVTTQDVDGGNIDNLSPSSPRQ